MDYFSSIGLSFLFDNTYFITKFVIYALVVILFFTFIISRINKYIAVHTHTRRQKSNINIFISLIKYLTVFTLIFGILFHYSASLKDFGIVLGALTAAMGLALQKPISSVAAWFMIVVKRPFDIGDRIIIDGVKGNVMDISITHIHLEEVGRYGGEEVSGRIVIIPNSILFEKSITNYSSTSDYILGQVVVTVSYESNINKTNAIVLDAAKKYSEEYGRIVEKDLHTRLYFSNNGMEVHVRYYVPFDKAQEVATNITKEIYDQIRLADDIEISYTHTKVILDK